MRLCISLASILVLIGLAPTTWAQDSTLTCAKYRLLLKKGGHEVGTGGVIRGGEFSGQASDGSQSNYKVSEILRLDRLKGSKGGDGALIGAGLGAVTAISAIIQVETDPNMELREDRVLPVTLILVGGGALIGFLVGSSSDKWERVPLNKLVGVKTTGELGVQFSVRF